MDTLARIEITTKEDRVYNYTISSDEYSKLDTTGILSFRICNRAININLHTNKLNIFTGKSAINIDYSIKNLEKIS